MSSSTTCSPGYLPAGVERQLTIAIRRGRRLRTAWAVGVLVLVLAATAGSVILADSAFDLAAEARGVILAGWLILGGWLIFRVVCRPTQRVAGAESSKPRRASEDRGLPSFSPGHPVPSSHTVPIAAAVEEHFP